MRTANIATRVNTVTMKTTFINIKKKLGIKYAFHKTYRQWKRINAGIQPCESKRKHLIIVPCDPWSVGGSRGDEAMIMAVIHKYRHKFPQIPISIVCAEGKGMSYIEQFPIEGVRPINSWTGSYPLERIYQSILKVQPSDVVILGADCMDGFYSPLLSLTLLALHDLCANTIGISSYLLGFSFNSKPNWMMIRAFRSLSNDTVVSIRDAISLERYQQKVGKPARLVADAAFMLQPEKSFHLYEEIAQWVSGQKTASRVVIGLNFHPMLRKYNGADDIKSDALKLAIIIEEILLRHKNISFVFISHDDRSKLTDNLMLSNMVNYLKSQSDELIERVFYRQEVPRAHQLKALCGLLDGLISSRMHLAIAALGMGTPVMAATYQGKFEGLFKHFELDRTYLLEPNLFLSSRMIAVFENFIENLHTIKKQINTNLPQVLAYSNANLKDE